MGIGAPDPTGESFDAVEIVRTRKDEIAEQRRLADQGRIVRGLPADVLADELRLRGWTVLEPTRSEWFAVVRW
jgi:hypothetical protein